MANHPVRAGLGTSESPALRLQTTMASARVSFTWLGVRKTLTADQRAQAAEPFGAEGRFLSAAKKLLDTAHPAFRAVTAIRNRILSYWRGASQRRERIGALEGGKCLWRKAKSRVRACAFAGSQEAPFRLQEQGKDMKLRDSRTLVGTLDPSMEDSRAG